MVGRGTLFAISMLLLAGGCRRDAEEKQRRADEATEKAEEKARESTLTSGTMEKKDATVDQAEDDALRAKAEALVSLRREQLDYRGRLQHALDVLDLDLANVRSARIDAGKLAAPPDPATVAKVRRREELARDVAAVDRSTEQDWPALRARIDRELAQEEPR